MQDTTLQDATLSVGQAEQAMGRMVEELATAAGVAATL